jgi:hypothetical protein
VEIRIEVDPGYRIGSLSYLLSENVRSAPASYPSPNQIIFQLKEPTLGPSRDVAANPATPEIVLSRERDGVYWVGLSNYKGGEMEYLNMVLQCGQRESMSLRFTPIGSIPVKFLEYLIVLEDPAQPSGLRVVPRASTD